MCRPAQEGISHLQDAQDLVHGLGLAQDLVRPADEKSLPFLCILLMRNQFLGESYTIFLAFCIILGFKQLQNLPGGVIMLLSHLRPRHSGPRAAKDQNDSAKGAIILQYHPL